MEATPTPDIPPTQLKVAVVTGASSGIGRATALALSRAGWSLALFARRLPELHATQAACADPAAVLVVAGDVTLEADVERLFGEAVGRFGRVDLLFNNAGMSSPALPLASTPLASFTAVLATNVVGPFLCTRAALRIFASQSPPGGRIVNNGSLAAHVPRPNAGPYTVSKHAVAGLTKQTALEGRGVGVAVTQLDIGNAHTPMAAPHTAGALQPDGRTAPEPTFDVAHAADAVVWVAGLPTDVTVLELNVMATGMPYVGRG